MASRHTVNTVAIVAAIVRSNYAASADQVEQLAHVIVTGVHAGEIYLRVVLARMQSRLGRPRRGSKQPDQTELLETVHKELYPSFLKGVAPDEVEQDERHRLGIAARTIATTVRNFIRFGGDVRAVDINTVTKTSLLASVRVETTNPIVGGTRAERAFMRAVEGVKKQVAAMARGDPANARERLEGLLDELDVMLASLPVAPAEPPPADVGGTTTVVGARVPDRGAQRTRVGVPQLHRGA